MTAPVGSHRDMDSDFIVASKIYLLLQKTADEFAAIAFGSEVRPRFDCKDLGRKREDDVVQTHQ